MSHRRRSCTKLVPVRSQNRPDLQFDDDPAERLASLAADADGTPLPGPLFTAMDYGIATAVGITILSD